MARSTPWGQAQFVTTLERGIACVGTASHGGFMVAQGYADKHLSDAAKKRGERHGGYLCYEEDCAFSIPLFELPHLWDKVYGYRDECEPSHQDSLLQTLSRWYPDYLIERSFEPESRAHAPYLADQENDRLRREHSPDLVVCAFGDWHHGPQYVEQVPPGAVGVMTADSTFHLVTAASYRQREGLNLLSTLEPFAESRTVEQRA